MPDWFDDFGRQGWHRIVGLVESLGLLAVTDGASFEIYAAAYSRLRWAQKELEYGVVAMNAQNSVRSHPAVAAAQSASTTMLSILTEYGLTAASRSKVSVAKSEEDDPLAAFMAPALKKRS